MSRVRRSLLFSFTDRYLTQVIMVATTMIMARILTPAETGLFLIAHAVILLAENLREFGVAAFIVQERELSRPAVQSAFTVTALLSLVVAGVVIGAAEQIADYYGQAELRNLLTAATLSLVFVPFATPILALLRRELAFRALAGINIAVGVANAGITVALGMAGYGAMSYVCGYVAASALLAFLAFLIRPHGWVFRPSLFACKRVLTFGVISSSVTVVNMAYDLLPRLLLGRVLGLDAVGLYSRALTVCQLPDRAVVSALQPVVLPALAARARDGGDLKTSYLRGHELMSAIQWPALTMLALLADPVVGLLLGPQWHEAAPLVRLVSLATMALAPAFMTYPVLVAAGRVRATLLASLISLPPSFLIILVAAPFGLQAVAASLFVVAPLQMLVALLFIRPTLGLTLNELARASRKSLALTVGTAVLPCTIVATSSTGFDLDPIQTVIAMTGGGLGWLLTLFWSKHPIRGEIAVVRRLVMETDTLQRLLGSKPNQLVDKQV